MMMDENIAPQVNVSKKASKVPSSGTVKLSKGQKSIEETYTKKTQLEHILLRPDTYVGSVEKHTQMMWVIDPVTNQVVYRNCTFVPGLYKIFDEIVVNASDNKQRDPSMTKIDVTINAEEGFVRVWNNGNGIPIVMHAEHNVYVPELIFGHLLTGSNFDDKEEKTTGGRNGYGAKLANIFSTRFIVETNDKSRGLKYRQVFTDNMGNKMAPEIAKSLGEDFTCVTFYPDLNRFGMAELDNDIVALFSKRVYDIAGTTKANGPRLAVSINGTRIEAKSFTQYIGLYAGLEPPVAFEKVNDRWEIGVGISESGFQQISFVNSICTMKGGSHVNYITEQIINKLMPVIKKKNKGQEVKPFQIKNNLAVYVNALIVNPAFDSQTKENLTTKASSFGSTCVVSDTMIKELEKSDIIDNILNAEKLKQTNELKKKSGSKKSRLIGIAKLDDANLAGSSRSSECTLILTEGDSAKALAVSGLSVIGRDLYGVFPLKGKLLNVREATHAQMMKNEEVQNIAQILGLTFGKDVTNISSLRYGHLMIMTDQDHDGSHIKGLLINFIQFYWPGLLKIPGFLKQFITPIVKCRKDRQVLSFFTIPQFLDWKEANNGGKGWDLKYYKGLGTSTSAEAREYFSNLRLHMKDFQFDEQTTDMIDMAFAKKRVEDRKLWLLGMESGVRIDYNVKQITYNDFINKELILFSHADNLRSIPHFMDGFKPSQRKVLFAFIKENIKKEAKVAQLAGVISNRSAYHHGEVSLMQTIIGMAQNFVGSNNINLLAPIGQFGTRLMGGKDAASPRYVNTRLEAITRHVFHPDDDYLLDYLDDDGLTVEPTFYVPVIPTLLVNGCDGIGTGWSTSIPTYNPRDIIANLRLMIGGQQPVDMKPWYRGFIGDIQPRQSGNYSVAGVIEQVNDSTIMIKELPVGKWTYDYKQFLESILIGAPVNKDKEKDKEEGGGAAVAPFITDFKENHTDTTVLFTVTMPPQKLQEAIDDKQGIYKKFKLESSIATSNMHAFDINSQIRRYENVVEIMNAFFDVRIRFYDKRKAFLANKLSTDLDRLENKVRFVLEVIAGKIIVSNRKKSELLADLKSKGFRSFNEDSSSDKNGEESDGEDATASGGYDYLLGMKIWSLTQERVKQLSAQRDIKRTELSLLLSKTPEDLWLQDLDRLEKALDVFESDIEQANIAEGKAQRKAQSKKAYDSDEDDDEDYDSEFELKKKKAAKKKPSKGTDAMSFANLKGILIPRKIAPEVVPRITKAPKLDKAAEAADRDGEVLEAPVVKRKKPTKKQDSDIEVDLSDEESHMNVPLLARIAMNRQPREAAKKVVYKHDDEDDEEEDPLDMSEFIVSDDEDDEDFDDEDFDRPAKSKKPTAAVVKAKQAPKPTVAAAVAPQTKVVTAAVEPKQADIKKPTKAKEPKAAKDSKEPKQVKAPKEPKPAKEPKAKATAPKKKTKKLDSDEEDFDTFASEGELEVPVVSSRVPRAAAKKIVYDIESEGEDDFISEDMSNDSYDDDFESDFEGSKKPKKPAAKKASKPALSKATPSSPPAAAKKRAIKKSSALIDSDDEAFTPSTPSPSVVRKTKKMIK